MAQYPIGRGNGFKIRKVWIRIPPELPAGYPIPVKNWQCNIVVLSTVTVTIG